MALSLNRNVIGYEINKDFIEIIKDKLGLKNSNSLFRDYEIEFIKRNEKINMEEVNYEPKIQAQNLQLNHLN